MKTFIKIIPVIILALFISNVEAATKVFLYENSLETTKLIVYTTYNIKETYTSDEVIYPMFNLSYDLELIKKYGSTFHTGEDYAASLVMRTDEDVNLNFNFIFEIKKDGNNVLGLSQVPSQVIIPSNAETGNYTAEIKINPNVADPNQVPNNSSNFNPQSGSWNSYQAIHNQSKHVSENIAVKNSLSTILFNVFNIKKVNAQEELNTNCGYNPNNGLPIGDCEKPVENSPEPLTFCEANTILCNGEYIENITEPFTITVPAVIPTILIR